MSTMTPEQIIAHLGEDNCHRKAHTTASLALGVKTNTKDDQFDGVSKGKALLSSKFIRSAIENEKRLHDKTQDETAALVELADFVIKAPEPTGIGRSLVRVVDMNTATKRVRITNPAIAHETARGMSDTARGTATMYIELKPNDELESHESWDNSFLEDADWDVVAEETTGVSSALKLKESQKIFDFIAAVEPTSLAGGGLYRAETNEEWSFDDMVKMRNQMKRNYVTPDTLVMHDDQLVDLLTADDEKFIKSTALGDFFDARSGQFGRSILGLDVIVADQIKPGHVYMMDKQSAILFGIRRDSLLDSYETIENGNRKYGVAVSTRYELKVGLGVYLLRCENA